ncbi:KH domain-containing protein [Candidatus Saccharibacteria bacterium]|nr:KH domain-containing protein [Candidatus Saccharibacteria bacterium]
MATIDEQFVMYIVQGIVENPDDVKIERTEDDKGTLLSLTVNPDDLGRVIGKKGQTAQALRNLLRALGMKNDAHYHLKIVDTDKEDGVVETTTDKKSEDVETTTEETVEKSSKLADKTRAELADLDDLDI